MGQAIRFARVDFRNDRRVFGIKDEDRFLHVYIIGKTGTGMINSPTEAQKKTVRRQFQHIQSLDRDAVSELISYLSFAKAVPPLP
jgi:hypothetical protein